MTIDKNTDRLDVVSTLLANALLASCLSRKDRGQAGAEVGTAPAKPAPAARALVLA